MGATESRVLAFDREGGSRIAENFNRSNSLPTVHNWSRTFSCQPRVVRYTHNVEELADALTDAARSGATVRILGAGHSQNDAAMSDEHLLIVRGLDRIRKIDIDRREVLVEAGISLRSLSEALAECGLALPCLSSLARQTLAGALATGTHGTGLQFGAMSTWVQELEILTPDGSLRRANDAYETDIFSAGRLSLGSLGVHTAFRLKVVPDFDLRVEEGPITLEDALDTAWWSSADHARIWYLPYVNHAWGWRAFRCARRSRREGGRVVRLHTWLRDHFVGYHAFRAALRLAASYPSLLPTVNRLYAHLILRNARTSEGGNLQKFTFESHLQHNTAEWAVPLQHVREATLGVREIVERNGFRAHLPVEVRFSAGDDIWLSPCYGGPRCWIGVIAYLPWGEKNDWESWFAAFELHISKFDGRPHWAKHFGTRARTFHEMYPRWTDFQRVRARLDPEKRFRNSFTERVLDV